MKTDQQKLEKKGWKFENRKFSKGKLFSRPCKKRGGKILIYISHQGYVAKL
jgi:hypothetical protein